MPSGEIDTAPLVEDAFAKGIVTIMIIRLLDLSRVLEDSYSATFPFRGAGKKVFIPYTHKTVKTKDAPSVMDMVSLESIDDYRGLKRNSWGIPTPSKASLEARSNCLEKLDGNGKALDLVIVPGVAFDNERRRLGHGKGYYDYFFKRCFELGEQQMPALGMKISE
jgi:5-formyltetrahydrofolate cyclo-ligase